MQLKNKVLRVLLLCVSCIQPGMHVNGGPGMIQPPNIGVVPGPMPVAGPGPGPGPVQGAVGPPGNHPTRFLCLNLFFFLCGFRTYSDYFI